MDNGYQGWTKRLWGQISRCRSRKPVFLLSPRSVDGLGLATYPLPWFSFTKPWFADENSCQAFGRHQADPAIDLDVCDPLVPPAGSLPTHSPMPCLMSGCWGGGWGVGVNSNGRRSLGTYSIII